MELGKRNILKKKETSWLQLVSEILEARLELARQKRQRILSPQRLPIPPLEHFCAKINK
jgi:hypothetical protein